jgi:hypothetical protein
LKPSSSSSFLLGDQSMCDGALESISPSVYMESLTSIPKRHAMIQ